MIVDSLRVSGTKYDRRVKLTDDQREYIRWLREEEQLSLNKLAKMFGVSKRLITFVCDPNKEATCKEQFKERRKDGRYAVSKEERAAIMREHRHYKKELHEKGLI